MTDDEKMLFDEKIRFTDFLSAAKRTASGIITPDEKKKEDALLAGRAAQKRFYDQFIRPIANALCALPEKNGMKFSCSVNYENMGDTPVLRARILYHAVNDAKPAFSHTTKKLSITLYGSDDNHAPVCSSYADAFDTGNSTDISPKHAAETPAALGKWVAQAAPERLAELEAAQRGTAPRRIRIMNPLNPKKPK